MKKTMGYVVLSLLSLQAHAEESTATPEIPTPAAPQIINCSYRIPATQEVEPNILQSWAEKAGIQAFEFSHEQLDQQLDNLKACFTDQGWTGFYDALQKSGNLEAIKTQKLTVGPQVDGKISVNPVKQNQWRVTLPMTVVYRSETERLAQQLSVDLLIGRKVSGDLGILQVIASPAQTEQIHTPPETN